MGSKILGIVEEQTNNLCRQSLTCVIIDSMSINQKIRKLDIFKKVPKDLSQGSNIGGCISIVTAIMILFYIYSEIIIFLNPTTKIDLMMDDLFTRKQMVIKVDMVLYRFPCEILSFDLQDIMMSHHPNIGSIKKYRLDANGERLDKTDFEILREPDQAKQLQMAEKAFRNKYGCHIQGSFTVKEVPGNFHISSHAYQNIYARLMMGQKIKTLDVSHKINQLIFGEQRDLKWFKDTHNPIDAEGLNKHQRTYEMQATPHSYTSHYHLDIVPTEYQGSFGKALAYQYTWNHNTYEVNHMPSLYFNYHVGGLKLGYKPRRNVFAQFLLNLCAVIGGIYALANFVSNTLQTFSQNNGYELVN